MKGGTLNYLTKFNRCHVDGRVRRGIFVSLRRMKGRIDQKG